MGVRAAQQYGDQRKGSPSINLCSGPPTQSDQTREKPPVLGGSEEQALTGELAEPGCGEKGEAADELVRNRQEIGFKLKSVSGWAKMTLAVVYLPGHIPVSEVST